MRCLLARCFSALVKLLSALPHDADASEWAKPLCVFYVLSGSSCLDVVCVRRIGGLRLLDRPVTSQIIRNIGDLET